MRRCLSRVYFILILVLHWLWWRLQLLFQRSLSAMGDSLLLSYVKMPQYAENVIYFFSCFLWLPMLIYSINPIFIRSCWRGKCRRNECCWKKNEKNKWLSRFIFVHIYFFLILWIIFIHFGSDTATDTLYWLAWHVKTNPSIENLKWKSNKLSEFIGIHFMAVVF